MRRKEKILLSSLSLLPFTYGNWYWVNSFDNPETPENEFDYRGWFGVKDLPEIKETEYQQHAEKIVAFEGDLADQGAKQHIFNVAKRWLDPNQDGDPSDGVDGFRLDVAVELPLGFWREFREEALPLPLYERRRHAGRTSSAVPSTLPVRRTGTDWARR